jgi:hypothetical protein
MNTARTSGFVKEAGLKDWAGVGLGALGVAVGGAGLYAARESRQDTETMRRQSRAADALHSAMLFESRTGQRLQPGMRKRIGINYMKANQRYRRRFGHAPTASAETVSDNR